MARIVGITGPSGSGKSLLTKEIQKLDIPTIDADAVYHDLLIPPSSCLDAIAKAFGKDILSSDGYLNRQVLASRVFSDAEQLSVLNRTVLPIVIERINEIIAELASNGARTIVLDAPTLIESGFHTSCDMIIAVIAPLSDRIERIMLRDGISRERATERISSQNNDEFYTAVADITLFNNQTEEAFISTAKEIATAISTL